MREAINNYSGLIICAAGNKKDDIDSTEYYPASFPLDNILVVGASDSDNKAWDRGGYGSNRGETAVDVFAPGVGILSCFPTAICLDPPCIQEYDDDSHRANGYHVKSGTSMAAPYVTAIAALMLSENPNLTPIQIKNKIIETCTDYAELGDKCVSGGVVNAYKAVLNAPTHTNVSANSSRTVSIPAGRSCWFKFTATTAGTYSFYTTGSQYTVGKLYSPTYGLLDSSNNAGTNFCVTSYLSAFQTVYLRVTLGSASASGNVILYVESE